MPFRPPGLAEAPKFVVPVAVALAALPAGVRADSENLLSCNSDDGSRRHCPGFTGAGVALRQSTGTSSCLLGRNWGYDASGVWVTEGCGGIFVLGNPAHEEQRLAAQSRPPDTAELPVSTAPEPSPEDARPRAEYTFYGRLGAQGAISNDESAVQDASSRIGFRYHSGWGDFLRVFAATELSLRITGSPNPFNPGETTSSGFVLLEPERGNVFGPRLGYVGIDFDEWGRVAFGKQWGVHYDITSFTDRFNVFGGDASATYNAGTDGGLMGTGRADSALSYRNTLFGMLDLGLQVQLRDVTNGEVIDGFGVSAVARLSPSLRAGASYTEARYEDSLRGQIPGLRGDGRYGAVGVEYKSERLTLAGVFARQRNGDLTRIPVVDGDREVPLPVVFDGDGFELFARYQVRRVGLLGGYLNYRPESSTGLIDPDAELEYLVLGTDFRWNPDALFFAEYRFSDGRDALGVPGVDYFVLGFKYSFRKDGFFSVD
jgi:predicted porin